MAKTRPEYRKLSGRSTLSVQKAFLAEDHILIVDGQFKETYKRLAYNDIEAILICPTKSASVFALISFLVGIPMMLSLPLAGMDYLPMFIFGGILALFGVLFIYGKGSVVFGVRTAVQTVVLGGINTQRKAQKAEAMLVSEIERVQGALTDEALQQAIYTDVDRYGARVGAWTRQEPESPTVDSSAKSIIEDSVAGPPPIKPVTSEPPAEV